MRGESHRPDYLQVDHKKPRPLQGKDDMDNYGLLCYPYNRKKFNKLMLAELRGTRKGKVGLTGSGTKGKRDGSE